MSTDEGKNWQRAEDIPQGDTAMFIEHPFDNRLVGIIYSVLFVTPQCVVPLDTATVPTTPPPYPYDPLTIRRRSLASSFTVTASLGHHHPFAQA